SWLERYVDIVKVVGSSPIPPTRIKIGFIPIFLLWIVVVGRRTNKGWFDNQQKRDESIAVGECRFAPVRSQDQSNTTHHTSPSFRVARHTNTPAFAGVFIFH
ncbi:MAG: hypothetical protein IKV10_03450, partial [Alphaproteobacteria bacterium]|nr:hypothetical protein [Alphaproteobacteria bacterium]